MNALPSMTSLAVLLLVLGYAPAGFAATAGQDPVTRSGSPVTVCGIAGTRYVGMTAFILDGSDPSSAASVLSSPWLGWGPGEERSCASMPVRAFMTPVDGRDIAFLTRSCRGFPPWGFPQGLEPVVARLIPHPTHAQAPIRQRPLGDLPLVEVAAPHSRGNTFAVLITGDGGWAAIDRAVGDALAERGIPVVGLNALLYFWQPRTPQGAARDLARILRYYGAAWHKRTILLVGYSRGADAMPLLFNRLPSSLARRVKLIALLAPAPKADLETGVLDLLGGGPTEKGWPLLPELRRLRNMKVLCLYGVDDPHALCRNLTLPSIQVIAFPGGHHFGGDYQPVIDAILRNIPLP